jgi:hypothetical protein
VPKGHLWLVGGLVHNQANWALHPSCLV